MANDEKIWTELNWACIEVRTYLCRAWFAVSFFALFSFPSSCLLSWSYVSSAICMFVDAALPLPYIHSECTFGQTSENRLTHSIMFPVWMWGTTTCLSLSLKPVQWNPAFRKSQGIATVLQHLSDGFLTCIFKYDRLIPNPPIDMGFWFVIGIEVAEWIDLKKWSSNTLLESALDTASEVEIESDVEGVGHRHFLRVEATCSKDTVNIASVFALW